MSFGDLNESVVKSVVYAVDARGQGAVDDLRRSLDLTNGSIQQTIADYQRGTIGINAYQDAIKCLIDRQSQLSQKLAASEVYLNKGAAGLNSLGSGGTAAARGLAQLSYGLEDLATGGWLGALNNISPAIGGIAESMNISTRSLAALTTGVTLAATAAYVLYQNWDRLNDALGLSTTGTEAEEMEKLADSTHRTAEETRRLNQYKREQSDIERLRQLRSRSEQETDKAVTSAIAEAGGLDPVLKGLVQSRKLAAAQRGENIYASTKAFEELARNQSELDATNKSIADAKKLPISSQVQLLPGLQIEAKRLGGEVARLIAAAETELLTPA